jgi:predicted secreted Zn-dependent protease
LKPGLLALIVLSAAAPLLHAQSNAPATSMHVEYYDVRGTTWDALAREVKAKGPEGGWWGDASSKISYKYRSRGALDGCTIESVTVNVDSTVRLPRWANRSESPAALQSQWDGMLRALDLHERGHVRISLDSARELERALKALPEQSTCAALGALAGERAQAILAEHSRKQDAYDAETDHGRKQGAYAH